MRKVWSQLKSQLNLEPWDWEMNLLHDQGMDPYKAECLVITKWMKAGNFKPMLASIRENKVLRGPALGLLVKMIESGQLTFKKGRGRPPDPEAAVRNLLSADTYEDFLKEEQDFLRDHRVNSEGLFRAIGSLGGRSEESIRQAVTAKRKAKTK